MLVIAILTVRNFDALARFEKEVAVVLETLGARILYAVETQREDDGTGEEIHVLSFPDDQAFSDYRTQTNTEYFNQLREAAIAHIDIKIGKAEKVYS